MSTFTAADGKRYFKDSHGAFREVGTRTDLGVPSVPQVEETRQVEAAQSITGKSQGGFGNTQPNACDDPEYLRKHCPSQIGVDGEPIEHAGSANHPLNNLKGWLSDSPYQPTRLPEEIVAEQNAIAAAEVAAEEQKQ
jgi:hypothetical protein